MSPLARSYKAGSIIYFEGDKADTVFVLQTGLVALLYIAPEQQREIREDIKAGEFFGVKSALGRFPREETAQVLTDTAVLVFSTQEFEALAQQNHKLVMKMLKVFSNQLRRITTSIRSMLDGDVSADASDGLFKIGEFYLKNKKFPQALYAYQKYLLNNPSGPYAEQSKQRIEMARSGASTGYAIASDGTSFVEVGGGDPAPAPARRAPEPAMDLEPTGIGGVDNAKQYYAAVSMHSQGKFDEAYKVFSQIVSGTADPEDQIVEKAHFDMARCLQSLGRHQEAVSAFTGMLRAYPRTENMKEALFQIGRSYAELGDNDKAASFYRKVIGMPPADMINKKAQKALGELGGG